MKITLTNQEVLDIVQAYMSGIGITGKACKSSDDNGVFVETSIEDFVKMHSSIIQANTAVTEVETKKPATTVSVASILGDAKAPTNLSNVFD